MSAVRYFILAVALFASLGVFLLLVEWDVSPVGAFLVAVAYTTVVGGRTAYGTIVASRYRPKTLHTFLWLIRLRDAFYGSLLLICFLLSLFMAEYEVQIILGGALILIAILVLPKYLFVMSRLREQPDASLPGPYLPESLRRWLLPVTVSLCLGVTFTTVLWLLGTLSGLVAAACALTCFAVPVVLIPIAAVRHAAGTTGGEQG